MGAQTCPTCGSVKRVGAAYCFKCGTRLDAVAAPSTQMTSPPPLTIPDVPMAQSSQFPPGTTMISPTPTIEARMPRVGPLLRSQAVSYPSLPQALGGAAAGMVLGAMIEIMFTQVLFSYGFLSGIPYLYLVLSALVGGVVVGLATLQFGGGRDGTTIWLAGAGALLLPFAIQTLWSIVQSRAFPRFFANLSIVPFLVTLIVTVGAAVGITLLKTPFRPWETGRDA